MTRLGFVVHPRRPAADDMAAWVADQATEAGFEVTRIGDGSSTMLPLDAVVSFGGDGTFLRAAGVAAEAACPVLGVKVGRLGFLTEVDAAGVGAMLEGIASGHATIESRTAVEADIQVEGTLVRRWGLNEVIVEKSVRHRLVRLQVSIDGESFTTFSADGVIVATPTGSTAYSFSAGGPIVTPTVDCLILTPVAAHMVFDRSVVLAPNQEVRLEVQGEEAGVFSADGQDPLTLPIGSSVVVRRAATPVRVVRSPESGSFLGRVRDKFELPRGTL